MIFKRLIIFSNKESKILKEYNFNDVGLNIILGEKSLGDESNGVGKTSLVESIKYILGGAIPSSFIERANLLEKEILLILSFEIDGEIITLARNLKKSDYGYINENFDGNFEIEENPWKEFNKKKYKEALEKIILVGNIDTRKPTFASLRRYLIRDEKNDFNQIILDKKISAIDSYLVINYLFNIDGTSEKYIEGLKKELKELNKELKLIKSMIGNITEIKIKEKKLEEELKVLTDISENIDINKNINISKSEYQKLKLELNETLSKILKLETIKSQYKENILDLEKNKKKVEILDEIEKFYSEILEYFPGKVKRDYDEVTQYYEFMEQSRGRYFKEKILQVNEMLESLEARKEFLELEVKKQLEILNSTTVVEDLNNIVEKINQKNQELAKENAKIDYYSKKEELEIEINKVKQEIIREANRRSEIFNNYKYIIKAAEERFNEIVEYTYGEVGVLQFEFTNDTGMNNTTGRVKITCCIPDETSHGRVYMKVNMFDLTWLIQRIVYNLPLQFLFHDGSYVKPDNKKAKMRLLKYVDSFMQKAKKGQYFVTLNDDELEHDDVKLLAKDKKIVAILNKELDSNRFMGIKYD